jgi:mannose/fructose/N-acetylgalactosamine-specific phosphotransferase system component IIC
VSFLQALLIAVIVGLAYLARRIGGDPGLERPIILGPIVGLILGDMQTGIIVGGSLELVFLGASPIGGSVPPNVAIGAAIGTALAVGSGNGVQTALVTAVPAAIVGTFFELGAKTVCSFLVHRADRAAEEASGRSILAVVWVGNAVHFLAYAIPSFLVLRFGSSALQSLLSGLNEDVQAALNTAAALLPAVGFAILLSVLYNKALFPLFFAGFSLSAYTGISVIGIAILATALVVVIMRRPVSSPATPPPSPVRDDGVPAKRTSPLV